MRKLRDHFFVQATAGEIFAGFCAFGTAEAFLEEGDGALVYIEKLAAQAGFFGFAFGGVAGFRQGNAELLRHHTDGFGEGDVFDFLDEAEDVAGEAAAEAMIELARGVDRERRGFFAVKGAEAGIVLGSGFL
jgi:hypothetical protein